MGVFLIFVGLAALAFGFVQHLKGKRILAAPFKKTGEIAKNPTSSDPKGLMSTEGNVVPPQTPVLSPLSKTACLYYEVAITRKWEKTEQTQDGAKTTKGSTTVETLKGGAEFGLDDGTGAILVDASKGGDFDNLKKQADAGGVHMSDGYVKFGELRIPTPRSGSDDYTLGFEAVEKIVPVGGSLFALGKLENGKLGKPGWRSMMFSTKGRDGLLASTAKKKKFSFIGGGIGAVVGIPLMIFGPKSAPGVDHSCHNQLAAAVQEKCNDNTSTGGGEDYAWTVDKAATYHVKLMPPQGKKFPMIPVITITNEKGDVVGSAQGGPGDVISVDQAFEPGKYTINMKSTDTASAKVKGGYDFSMEITGDGLAVPATGEAVAAAAAPKSAEDLAARVTELNELCGDTWCEGSFQYKFTTLSCDEGRGCALAFTATNSSTKKNYDSMVIVNGFTELRPDPTKDFKFEGSFDEAVGNALTKWEANPTSKPGGLAAAKPEPKAKNVAAAGKKKK